MGYEIAQHYEDLGIPNPDKQKIDASGMGSKQVVPIKTRKTPNAAALPTAAPGSSFQDSNNPVRGPYYNAMSNVPSSAQPTPTAQSNRIINPAVYQGRGNTVGSPQLFPDSVVNSDARPTSAAHSNGVLNVVMHQGQGNHVSYGQPFPGSDVESGAQPTSAAHSNGVINAAMNKCQENTVSYPQPFPGSVVESGVQSTPSGNSHSVTNPAIYQGQDSDVSYPQPFPGSAVASNKQSASAAHNSGVIDPAILAQGNTVSYRKSFAGSVIGSGAQPTAATQSNGVINPAFYQARGSTVTYQQPSQGSVPRSNSFNGARAEARPNEPAPGAPNGQQGTRTALSTLDSNANRSAPSANPTQQPYFDAPSAQWIMDEGQQVIKISFEDAKKLYQRMLNDWHQWPVVARDHEIPPLFGYVSRGAQHMHYTIPARSLLGQLLTPQPSGTNMFGQQPPGNSQLSKAPAKAAPKKGGRGRPKKQAQIEDQTHVDMMDYHGPPRNRRFSVQGNHEQQLQAPAVQPGSTQLSGFQQPQQATSNGNLRGAGWIGVGPAAYPLDANGKSQDLNGQAHGLRQPSAVGPQATNRVHRWTQFDPVSNSPSAFHQGQSKQENFAISAHPPSTNDRKRSREVNDAEPDTAREAKKARTTPSASNFTDKGRPEMSEQKQEAAQVPGQAYDTDEDQPKVQVCIGNLDPRAAGAAMNMALDALRTGQALLKARPGEDAICFPPNSHIVCLPQNDSTAWYGPSNTITAGRQFHEMPATSYSAGWTAASQHHSLAMAGVPIQDIKIEVFDRRKHQLTGLPADSNPKTHVPETTAPIGVDVPLESPEGRQRPDRQAPSAGYHTSDAAALHNSLPIDVQRDEALPGAGTPASYPENNASTDSIRDDEQATTKFAGGPSVALVNQPGLAATGSSFANAGANSDVIDSIMNDPTIPGLDDLSGAGDILNTAEIPDLNGSGIGCLDTQDTAGQGEPVIPLAPAAQSDNVIPPESLQDTAKFSRVNTCPGHQAPSGPAITTRETIQAPVMPNLATTSPSTASHEQMVEAAETSKNASYAAKENHAVPAVISERRKQCKYIPLYLISFSCKANPL